MSVVDSEAKADTNGRKELFEFKAELGCSFFSASYREAIDVLYSGNTFSFKTYRGFVMFTRSIPPPRLANLTHITIAQSTMTVDGPTDYETEEERYRRNCTYDDFFTIITSLPRLKVLVMSYEVLSAGGDPYWLQSELALLDEMGRRNDMGGVEVWYEIVGSVEGLERFREREYDRRTWCLEGWTRWEVGERCSLR
ncbi:uncharacterized protein J4E79_009581 [Alternaria viburni]|uniref:uncharacterized protein n=1 Tax=Alternaria viburni TaxID=566460 RepID=UPI0020C4C5B9|nr:uncharacterized protein J4E79_009581 [Alternaria viburni]KAI4650312.1 hypothetical protein J4E79_009581 [Alternaria viburni]